MTTSLELRDFQWASVKAVCDGLLQRSVFALADEVGLGKTLVCAEVVNQLLRGAGTRKQHLIYYVAPSIELLHQNLRSIRRYLESRCGSRFNVWTPISRLSQVPRDFAEYRRRHGPEKEVIHVIGLSPGTSFSLRGAGQRSEREFLAALFGYRKHSETKQKMARLFWCLNRDLDLRMEQRYLRNIEGYASEEFLGGLTKFQDTPIFERLVAEFGEIDLSSRMETRKKVAEVRHRVVDFLLESVIPSIVIFDEWHKYKNTCFTNELLGRFLEQSRRSSRTKVLLVSATPFSVEFNDDHYTESPLEGRGDLEGLLQMVWGKDRYLPEYQKLVERQNAYLSSIGSFLKNPTIGDSDLARDRNSYERLLRTYCSRTERPRTEVDVAEMQAQVREGNWSRVVESGSLRRFTSRFSKGQHVRTPILGMWSDGLSFPSYGYAGLDGHSTKDVPGIHWKIQRLAGVLKEEFCFEDNLHTSRYPPLWLAPGCSARNRKLLVFSDFLFVPNEVCRRLDALPVKFGSVAKKKWTGSALGYFPIKQRRRVRSKQSAAEAIHFALFYPFLMFELPDEERRKTINARRAEIGRIIDAGIYALDVVRKIDELFCADERSGTRVKYRWHFLDSVERIPASKRFKEYLRFLVSADRGEWSLGRAIARVCKLIVGRDPARSTTVSREFEAATMRLSAAVLRLFASPESQTLKRQASVRLPRSISRRWNSHVRFAMWYSKKFDLEGALGEFASLLSASGVAPEAIVDELGAAIGLRKGTVGNRFVRSFHDRKIGDAEYADESEESISVKSLRAAFNSPFPPYVLVSTSVGQEGLDFHRYCASIIHWSPPSSPSVLRQREGRLDRFQALQIRRALRELGDGSYVGQDGMSPDFVVMKDGKRVNRVDRGVWYLPFTAQEAAWRKCLQRMHYNDLLIGAPDPLSDEKMLLGAVGTQDFKERLARFRALQTHAVSLKPHPLTAKELASLR